ncbi:VOC family protein [Streptomyces sp. NPDC014623]|uniref:VOC family protein n=1 Tax=Streptomyces sp. NPDC014623 TaxID=3364875 RepID=UPI0036F6D1DE
MRRVITESQCAVPGCPGPARPTGFYATVAGREADRTDKWWTPDEARAAVHAPAGSVLRLRRVEQYLPPRGPASARPDSSTRTSVRRIRDGEVRDQVLTLGASVLNGESVRAAGVCAQPAGHPSCPALR